MDLYKLSRSLWYEVRPSETNPNAASLVDRAPIPALRSYGLQIPTWLYSSDTLFLGLSVVQWSQFGFYSKCNWKPLTGLEQM